MIFSRKKMKYQLWANLRLVVPGTHLTSNIISIESKPGCTGQSELSTLPSQVVSLMMAYRKIWKVKKKITLSRPLTRDLESIHLEWGMSIGNLKQLPLVSLTAMAEIHRFVWRSTSELLGVKSNHMASPLTPSVPHQPLRILLISLASAQMVFVYMLMTSITIRLLIAWGWGK